MSSVSLISILLVAGFLFCLGVVEELGRERKRRLCRQRYKCNAGSLYTPKSLFKSHSLASSRNLSVAIVSDIEMSFLSTLQPAAKLVQRLKDPEQFASAFAVFLVLQREIS